MEGGFPMILLYFGQSGHKKNSQTVIKSPKKVIHFCILDLVDTLNKIFESNNDEKSETRG